MAGFGARSSASPGGACAVVNTLPQCRAVVKGFPGRLLACVLFGSVLLFQWLSDLPDVPGSADVTAMGDPIGGASEHPFPIRMIPIGPICGLCPRSGGIDPRLGCGRRPRIFGPKNAGIFGAGYAGNSARAIRG